MQDMQDMPILCGIGRTGYLWQYFVLTHLDPPYTQFPHALKDAICICEGYASPEVCVVDGIKMAWRMLK